MSVIVPDRKLSEKVFKKHTKYISKYKKNVIKSEPSHNQTNCTSKYRIHKHAICQEFWK